MPRERRPGRAHLVRQHHQEAVGHRLRLCQGRPPLCLRFPVRAGEAGGIRPRLARVLPHPDDLRGRRMAAVAQVRLRDRHGQGPAGAGPRAGPRPLRRVVPRRLPADRSGPVGHRRGQGGDADHRPQRRRHRAAHGQPGRRLPGQVPLRRAGGRALCRRRHARHDQAFRQRPAGHDHRARPFAGGRRRRARDRGGADLAQGLRGRLALGLPGRRQVRRPGRDHGRGHQVPHRHPPRRRRHRAGGAGRPDLRFGGHPLRKGRLRDAGDPQGRRQGAHPVDRRLYHFLLGGQLQRLRALEGLFHLKLASGAAPRRPGNLRAR
ncbi:hypothetical protein MTBUT4_20120 [Magnetospirillum sp. UT-4]|nr:hypothetical protein MTBUT4_20120 [Magnetospirillum sp. UT-4]